MRRQQARPSVARTLTELNRGVDSANMAAAREDYWRTKSLASLEEGATVDNFPLPRGERVRQARQLHKELLKEQRMETNFSRTAVVL
jgi:hypothetical protein